MLCGLGTLDSTWSLCLNLTWKQVANVFPSFLSPVFAALRRLTTTVTEMLT